MRLIDADELLKGKDDHTFVDTHLIWNAPTVDAIPIEWIKEYVKYWDDLAAQFKATKEFKKVSENITAMIKNWESEQ